MASLRVICASLFLVFLHSRAQPDLSSFIRPGSSLYPNTSQSSWLSPSGHFAFGFYPQGNGFKVGIWLADKPNITVVWTANRNDPPVSSSATINFTEDGIFLLRTAQGDKKVFAELSNITAVSASMRNSGNFKIYDKDTEVIWESFQYPTDTILGGQSLLTQLNASRSTSDRAIGRFYLEVNNDGLAAYPVNHTGVPEECYWKVKISSDEDYLQLNLSRRGFLGLVSGNESLQTLASSSSSAENENDTVIYRATLDSDGIFRLYSHHFGDSRNSNPTLVWSAMQDQCQVIGFCGINSFCSKRNSRADCYCFPGFDFINHGMKDLGCYRSMNDEEGCERKEPELFYNISDLEKTKLGGFAYSMLTGDKQDCRDSCRDDCYCAAAFYVNETCSKLKLPLMFGREDENDTSATVFIKKISGSAYHGSTPKTAENKTVVSDSKKSLITILASSLGFVAFLCFFIAASSYLVYERRVRRYRKLPGNSNLRIKQEFSLRSFSYHELEQATNGFTEELGRGHFGAVYKGTISEGKGVAVKRLEKYTEEGEKRFRAEMAAVRRTHHRNLVRLLGFCVESSRKLLVYEYMSNGSLADLLFNADRRPLWKERVRMALNVAKGLLYLHEECEVQIIHCDIKPRNILMDDSWTAKITDFGLAKLLMPNQTIIDTSDKASRGYISPEWQKNGLITVKSDVYSFGVVLLEIVCCRSNMEVNVSTADEVLLSTWVYKCFVAGELDKLVGDEEVDMRTLERMVKVGLLCILDDPNLRPPMKKVILMLEGTMDIPVPPCPTPLIVI